MAAVFCSQTESRSSLTSLREWENGKCSIKIKEIENFEKDHNDWWQSGISANPALKF